ncbi:hypothetical protein [Streptomyces regalis]|uniref:Uncharacterized protein n=1 Tax=Streptomyces regalis TaxID=68262 RepID=A0A0X3VGD2_9ACTN|nr:hypothetical protein [Streptomyces regalis]KUL43654.1 hypothetical protein ADL12_07125 [Streptomyces regalis]
MRTLSGHCDRSPYGSFRRLQALTLHRVEQYMASDRRSTPTTHRDPHSGHSASPAPFRAAARSRRSRRSFRHCLARHADEQNSALGWVSGLNRSPQPRQILSPARPASSDTESA